MSRAAKVTRPLPTPGRNGLERRATPRFTCCRCLRAVIRLPVPCGAFENRPSQARSALIAQQTAELYAGIMSGTSHDGIDVALVALPGRDESPACAELVGFTFTPYEAGLRSRLRSLAENEAGVPELCAVNFELGVFFAAALSAALAAAGVSAADVVAAGCHGHTVWHVPPDSGAAGSTGAGGSTLQVGEAAVIAERTGIAVVADFRVRDVAAGGHGAPLAPYFDYLIFRSIDASRAVQNIGGMANVTGLPADPAAPPLAFDTGPGMALIDAAAEFFSGGESSFDVDGEMAARGQVLEPALSEWLADPFFAQQPPRSTGRERFGSARTRAWLEANADQRPEDLVATLTELTARSVADSYQWLDFAVDEVFVCGGGAHNGHLMTRLASLLPDARVSALDELGWPADSREAAAFALLARQHVLGIPVDVGWATGAPAARLLGKMVPA
ncbi:MAG: anhydro-N-acetylmuramic acid kinase [Gemmatimonadota bacterium]